MNKLYLQILVLASLAAQPMLATADHDDPDRQGRFGSNSVEWRAQGHDIYFRQPGERQWRQAPGSAHAVGDGWVIGTDRRNGGYGIYRWNGYGWQRMPGAAVDIGGSFQSPWVINDRGERFSWTGNRWLEDNAYRRRDARGERRHEDRWDHDRDQRRERRDRRDGRNH